MLFGRIKFKEKIDVDTLKRTLEIIIAQNEALRTRIIKKENKYYQYFAENVSNEVKIIEIKDKKNEEKKVKELSRKHIPIIDHDLMKFYILKYSNGTADVLSVSHHIIADAWTISMYAKEIIRIYQILQNNEEVEKINYSYAEYINEEDEYLKSDKYISDKEYWENEYKEEPTTRFFKVCNNIRGKREHYIIEKQQATKIKEYCKIKGVSEQCLFMAVFAMYLSKLSSSYNISIGMPVLNRKNFKNKKTMGMFIQTLPFRIDIDNKLKSIEFLKYINEKQYSFLKHHRYPYEQLQKDIKKKFESNQKSYSVAFSYQNAKIENSEEMECITSWEFNGFCPDDLQLHISDMQNTGTFNVYYDTKYSGIEKEEVKNIHNRLLYIIEQIIENDTRDIKDIEIITPQEREKILKEFNNTKIQYENELSVDKKIKEISEMFPDNIAVIDENRQITYKELENSANVLANELLKQNIKIGDVIGILFNKKDVNVIISIVATLKVGASFVLLYNDLPEDRVKYILSDSNAKAIITENKLFNKYNQILNIDIENLETKNNNPVNLNIDINNGAYLIYTSGTTGKPKGTEQTHNNIYNFIYSFYEILNKNIGEKDRCLSVTNVSFDVCIAEIFLPLFYGSTLHLYKELSKSTIEELVEYIVNNRITFAYFPPSMLEEIVEKLEYYKGNIALNKMLVGVEPIKNSTLDKFLSIKEDIHIINGYGPSETTICSTMYDFNTRKDNEEIVPIGKPLKNTEIYIMNSDRNLLPINSTGEIYILGNGLGKGYKFNEELNKEKYVEIYGKRAFKTGDLGKWNKNGDIIFGGRNDNQIKFRGYRIDLGEIENSLKSCNEVKNAIVMLDKDNYREEKLIAFIILNNKDIIEETLRDFLSKTLPYYMMPSKFIRLDVFPMTVNGKIDKKRLSKIALEQIDEKIVLPENEVEKDIYDIIKNKIKDREISIKDNFFDLGIDSLEAISLIVEFEKKNINFSLQDFYNYPSIKLLAKKVNNEKNVVESEKQEYIRLLKNSKNQKQTIDGNILLLGATGFLGSHILKQLLKETKVKIYCLVRATSKNRAKERLNERLSYYFGEEFCEIYEKRIIPINGDFTLEQFGMNEREYNKVKDEISMIINSAACVKHYGSSKYFYNINYLSVKKALQFCQEENKQFVQISTMSIFENMDSTKTVDEEVIYCNQNLENIYIKTKFEAEQAVATAIKNGNKATIFRLGNIMWRLDGKFQINEAENSFITKLKMMIQNKVALKDMIDYKVDLSPVDLCSEAIVKILLDNNMNIYHIENENKVSIKDLIKILKNIGISIEIVDKDIYNKKIINNVETKSELIALLENNISEKNIKSQKTIDYLKERNFEWNKIDEEYMKKYINNESE